MYIMIIIYVYIYIYIYIYTHLRTSHAPLMRSQHRAPQQLVTHDKRSTITRRRVRCQTR